MIEKKKVGIAMGIIMGYLSSHANAGMVTIDNKDIPETTADGDQVEISLIFHKKDGEEITLEPKSEGKSKEKVPNGEYNRARLSVLVGGLQRGRVNFIDCKVNTKKPVMITDDSNSEITISAKHLDAKKADLNCEIEVKEQAGRAG